MAMIRDGADEPMHEAHVCIACDTLIESGAVWRATATIDVALCRHCIRSGFALGMLVGDAARSATELQQMIDAVKLAALQSYAYARDREQRCP